MLRGSRYTVAIQPSEAEARLYESVSRFVAEHYFSANNERNFV